MTKKKPHFTDRYKRIRVKNPAKFDKRSLRTKDVGRPGHHKIIIGCKKGFYNNKKKKCRIGTEVQEILEER